MKSHFTWKKRLFSSLYRIYSKDTLIGNLDDKWLSRSAKGIINGKAYIFRSPICLRQHTEIIDCSDNKKVGTINYNGWMTRATISIGDKTTRWKYDNIWNTKWILFDKHSVVMSASQSTCNGQISSSTEDELLVLSGLFITHYYLQMTFVIMIIIIIPIWVT